MHFFISKLSEKNKAEIGKKNKRKLRTFLGWEVQTQKITIKMTHIFFCWKIWFFFLQIFTTEKPFFI